MTLRRFTVRWTEQATEDLEEIGVSVARRSATSARRVLSRLETRASKLSTLALRGRVVPELEPFGIRQWRELIEAPYRIVYSLDGHRVNVMAVLDARRDLQDELLLRLIRSRDS